MDPITIIGLAAATLTVVSLFPQLLKVWKTRSTKDISMGMFALLCTSLLLWLIYGIFNLDLPIILSNSFAFIQALVILIFKAKYK